MKTFLAENGTIWTVPDRFVAEGVNTTVGTFKVIDPNSKPKLNRQQKRAQQRRQT